MKNKKGILVKYKTKDGKCQRGMAYYSDQTDDYVNTGRVFIRVTDRNFEPILNDGKKVVAIKNREDCIIIGYID